MNPTEMMANTRIGSIGPASMAPASIEAIYADPIGYLHSLGIAAELVAEIQPSVEQGLAAA